MIWSFAEKDEEKVSSNASSMETATIISSSSCENVKFEKQSKIRYSDQNNELYSMQKQNYIPDPLQNVP